MGSKKIPDNVVIDENGDVLPDPVSGAIPAAVPIFFRAAYHIPLITKLAREGTTLADIAGHCGITPRHLSVWRQRFPAVDHAIVQGHLAARAVVENKLYEMALGLHEWDEVTEVHGMDGDGQEYTQTKTVKKRVKPSVNAQIFILKNIAPEKWKDKQEIKSEQELQIIWKEYRQELTPAQRKSIKALPKPVQQIEGEQNETQETEQDQI
jgi:hypothetical protein